MFYNCVVNFTERETALVILPLFLNISKVDKDIKQVTLMSFC